MTIKIVKIPAILLLIFFVFFLATSTFIALDTGMRHDGCFSISCGPAQPLFNDFALPISFCSLVLVLISSVIVFMRQLTSVMFAPETPPPKFI